MNVVKFIKNIVLNLDTLCNVSIRTPVFNNHARKMDRRGAPIFADKYGQLYTVDVENADQSTYSNYKSAYASTGGQVHTNTLSP